MPAWLDSFLYIMVATMLGITYSLHFVLDYEHPVDTMVAFVGFEHVRSFEKAYVLTNTADLWAFGHRPRRGSRVRFESTGTYFQMFEHMHRYKQMILLYHARRVPLLASTDVILEYRLKNETIGYLIPADAIVSRETNSLGDMLGANKVDVLELF